MSEDEIKIARATGDQNLFYEPPERDCQKRRGSAENNRAVLERALEGLCDTCKLFGSPFAAANMSINDLYLIENEWGDVIQRRDGVAIDRDSEKAKDRLKYDFEVVPASTTFSLRITLENASPYDLQLMSIGLSEFMHGFGFIGGKRSRGLGACLLKEVSVSYLDLEEEKGKNKNAHLYKYLLNKEFPHKIDGEAFLKQQMETIFPEVKEKE